MIMERISHNVERCLSVFERVSYFAERVRMTMERVSSFVERLWEIMKEDRKPIAFRRHPIEFPPAIRPDHWQCMLAFRSNLQDHCAALHP